MTFGLIYIGTRSAILHAPRMAVADIHDLFEVLMYCPACFGFWVGVALKYLGYWDGSAIEAGIISCALGALWGEYGPSSVWAQERGDDNTLEKKDE